MRSYVHIDRIFILKSFRTYRTIVKRSFFSLSIAMRWTVIVVVVVVIQIVVVVVVAVIVIVVRC